MLSFYFIYLINLELLFNDKNSKKERKIKKKMANLFLIKSKSFSKKKNIYIERKKKF